MNIKLFLILFFKLKNYNLLMYFILFFYIKWVIYNYDFLELI